MVCNKNLLTDHNCLIALRHTTIEITKKKICRTQKNKIDLNQIKDKGA
jgi:hypothetical protein